MAIWHKYPYTDIHDLNLDWIIRVVKEMKEKFDSIDFDYIFNTLTELNNITAQHTTEIAGLNDAISNINSQILDLANDLESQSGDIEALQDRVNGIGTQITQITQNITTMQGDIRDMKDDIAELQSGSSGTQGEIDGIRDDVDALDVRVTGLEDATYGTVTANPSNIFYSADMRNLDGVDFEIVKISGDFEDDDIYINDTTNMLTFYHDETSNTCKLVLKNILTDIDEYIDIDNVIINLGFLLDRQGGYHYTSFSNGLTISQLLSGYSGNDYFKTIKMVRNTNGDFDLEIQQYPQSFYLRITLKHMFVSLGQTPMTQALVKDFIGTPTQNLVGIIKKNSASQNQIDNLALRVGDIETHMVDDNEFNISQTAQDQRITANRTSIVALNDLIESIDDRTETVTYNNINDVFSGISSQINVLAFSLKVTGKIAHMYAILTNIPFDVQHFNQILLGTVRPAVREFIRPSEQIFSSTQIAYKSRWNGSDWVSEERYGPQEVIWGDRRNLLCVLSPDVGEPMNLIRNISTEKFDPNTFWMAVDDYVDTACNSAIIDMTWNVV